MNQDDLVTIYMQIVEVSIWVGITHFIEHSFPSREVHALILLVLAILRWRHILPSLRYRSQISWWPLGFLLLSAFTTLSVNPSNILLSNPGLTIVAPLYEELLYRIVLPKIPSLKNWNIVLPAILFGYAHRHTASHMDLCVCFLSGLALNVRVAKYGNVLETFAIHTLHNLHVLSSSSSNSHLIPIVFYALMIVTDLVGR